MYHFYPEFEKDGEFSPSSFVSGIRDRLQGFFQSREKKRADTRVEGFHTAKKKDWDQFLNHASRKSFVKQLGSDSRSDAKLVMHADNMNRLQTGKKIGTIQGGSKSYSIVKLRGKDRLGCTCNDWRYKRSVAKPGEVVDCKHIRQFKQMSKTAAYEEKVLTKEAGFWGDLTGKSVETAKQQYAADQARHTAAVGRQNERLRKNHLGADWALTTPLDQGAYWGDAGSRRTKRLARERMAIEDKTLFPALRPHGEHFFNPELNITSSFSGFKDFYKHQVPEDAWQEVAPAKAMQDRIATRGQQSSLRDVSHIRAAKRRAEAALGDLHRLKPSQEGIRAAERAQRRARLVAGTGVGAVALATGGLLAARRYAQSKQQASESGHVEDRVAQSSKTAAYEEGGSFTHDGQKYSLREAFRIARTKPTKQVDVDKLKWVLQYDRPDPKRLAAANLNAPVIVAPDRRGRPTVVDGLHRLSKAAQQGKKILPAKVLTLGELKKEAGHVEDRIAERAPGATYEVAKIRARIPMMNLRKGQTYHVPLKGGKGYAVIGDIGPKHVVKTVLGPNMKPPGERAKIARAPRDYSREYAQYHAKPEQVANRSMRNQARRKLGLKKGDPREADHKTPISKGGGNGSANLRAVSRLTNRTKFTDKK
jgi:hypothetical protein